MSSILLLPYLGKRKVADSENSSSHNPSIILLTYFYYIGLLNCFHSILTLKHLEY